MTAASTRSATATPTRASCRGTRPRGRRRPTARRSSCSTRPCSTRAAAASPRTAGSSCAPRTGARWTVRAARRVGGEIVHELEAARGRRAAGRRATGVPVDLEWARRYALMRTHTALHALCGVVWRDYGALVTGGNMEPGSGRHGLRVRDDVRGPRRRDRGRPSTTSCRRRRDVRVDVLPRAEAFAIPDLIRTKVNLLPEGIEQIRTIEIVGLDLQADGGTHVANTARGGRHPGHRLRVQGPDQQADPPGARRPRRLTRFLARPRCDTAIAPLRRGTRGDPIGAFRHRLGRRAFRLRLTLDERDAGRSRVRRCAPFGR